MKNKDCDITIYSTPTCPYCDMAKEYFKSNGIQFKNLDVGADRRAAEEMIQKSGQMGVPVIDVCGKIVVGFRPDVFNELLKN